MMCAGLLGRTEADRRLHATAAKLNDGPLRAACQFANKAMSCCVETYKRMMVWITAVLYQGGQP